MVAKLPPPRWETPLPPGAVRSWGPAVEAWAARELRIRLDRWQRRALNRALACDASGRLVHRVYLISTARQNGKTALVRALIGWALTAGVVPEWALIAGLAHDKKQARLPYRAVLADLAPMRKRVGPIGRGGLALTQYLGIRSALHGLAREYHYWSRDARDNLRGESVDLGVFDEVRTQRDEETWAALEPTTRARPDPLILAISSAGNDRSVLLREWWERGLRIIDGAEPADGFGMTWYAAPDDAPPDSRRAILAANPSVVEGRVPYASVAASFRSLSLPKYRNETLNLWADALDEWLPAGVWAATVRRQPDERGPRVVFGVEVVPTWRHASIVVAVTTDDGAWVGVVGELDTTRGDDPAATVSPDRLVRLIADLAETWRPASVAFAKTAAAAPHVEAWAAESDVATRALTAGELRAASELFRSELTGGRLTHADDRLLARQARAGRPSRDPDGGDWYLSVKLSAGPVDALRAAAWAAYVAIAPAEREAGHGLNV